MNISKTAVVSFSAFLDKTNPKGINIGDYSYIGNGAMILTHDYTNCRPQHRPQACRQADRPPAHKHQAQRLEIVL